MLYSQALKIAYILKEKVLKQAALYIFALSIAGYPGISLLSGCIEIPSFWFAIPFRSCIAVVAIISGFYSLKKTSICNQQKVLVLFLSMLGLRLLANVIQGFPISSKELAFYLSAVILPIFGTFLYNFQQNTNRFAKTLILLTGGTIILAIFSEIYGWLGTASLMSSRRLSSQYLNPITLGGMAGILLLSVLSKRRKLVNVTSKNYNILAILIGLFGLSFANSRGPLIAWLGTLLYVILVIRQNNKEMNLIRKSSMVAVLSILLFIFNPCREYLFSRSIEREMLKNQETQNITTPFSKYFKFGTTNRLDLNTVEIDERPRFYKKSWKGFMQNIWFGISDWEVFQKIPGYHAHNLFLGTFQNLGVFGGLVLTFCIVRTFFCANLWLRAGSYLMPCLFLQSFLLSQFSGSLFGQVQLFLSMAVLLGETNKQVPFRP